MQFHLISYIDNIVKNWSVRVKKLKKISPCLYMYKKTRKCQENTKNINQIHFYASADNMYKKEISQTNCETS